MRLPVNPRPQTIVQLEQRKRSFGIEVGQKLSPNRAKEALNFPSPLWLIRWCVEDKYAE